MQEVVEVGVGDGVASLGPVEEGAPAISEQGVDAAVGELAPLELQRKDERDAPRPIAGPNLAQSAIDKVNVVLLCDRAAVGRPGAIADDGGVDLGEDHQTKSPKVPGSKRASFACGQRIHHPERRRRRMTLTL